MFIVLTIITLSLTCTTVYSLTVDDFYNDTNAAIIETVTSTTRGSIHDLPVSISNIKDFVTASQYAVRKTASHESHFYISWQIGKGSVRLSSSPNPKYYFINTLFVRNPRKLTDGIATVQVSTDPELLKRALKDITDNYNVDPAAVTPTHLLLHNNIDIKASGSAQVWLIS